jgi:hypothetical protein
VSFAVLADSPLEYRPLTVVGTRAANNQVSHVAVLSVTQRLRLGDSALVCDQQPPLRLSIEENTTDDLLPNCSVASHFELSDDEVQSGLAWIQHLELQVGRDNRHPKNTYCIAPPFSREFDPSTGSEIRRRFSCVGFVLELYRAGVGRPIPLVTRRRLPRVSSRLLLQVWPDLERITTGPRIKQRLRELHDRGFKLGIGGKGPWRIVLPGYLVRAMASEDSPFLPASVQQGCLP